MGPGSTEEPTDAATSSDFDTLIESVNAAREESERVRFEAVATREELASERKWRRWAERAALGLTVVLIAAVLFLGFDIRQSSNLSRENHKILLIIQKVTGPDAITNQRAASEALVAEVVNETDCRVRDDIASLIHKAFPLASVSLPATDTCLAFTPS